MSELPILHPSIDLLGGALAELAAGELRPLAHLDPRARAALYARHGVLNVIDLDAALDATRAGGTNDALIRELCGRHECYVGGGVRTPEEALRRLRYGARKVILGSAPFTAGAIDRSFLEALSSRVPATAVVFALDTRAGFITTGAWTRATELGAEGVLAELEPYCSEFVLTAIEREGSAAGPDLEAIARFSARTRHPVQAAGGIGTIAHIRALSALGVSPVLSRVIHRDELDLGAAFLAASDLEGAGEAIATTVEDRAGRVLAAYTASRAALAWTLRTGECVAPAPAGHGAAFVPVAPAGEPLRAARVRVARQPLRVVITSEM